MTDFINKFKIPTILGLGIIILGLTSGLYLVLRQQSFLSQAAPSLVPQNITLTNQTEDSMTISWQTNSPSVSFVTFGQSNPGEQTVLDSKDATSPKPHLTHYVILKNLLPQTRYQFKIISNKITSDIQSFDTAKPLTSQGKTTPIIGTVLDENTTLNDGIVYLAINGATTQSALIKSGGNFLIPLSYIRKSDLSDLYPVTEDTIAKITIISDKGTASINFKLNTNSTPLAPVKLGQNIDLTENSPEPSPTTINNEYDLNTDGKINSADNAIILQNFGKKGKNIPGDLNDDEVINQKDLDLMAQKLEKQ